MKYSIAGIVAIAVLTLNQGCSSQVKSGETASQENTTVSANHNGHATEQTHYEYHSNNHSNSNYVSTQAKLTAPKNIVPNQPLPLVINIQDSQGKSISKFDKFQEQLMHLIVVSDDLKFFNHLHPNYKGNGRFEINTNFPEPNNYTIFSDYKPSGKQEEVTVMKITVPGSTPVPQELAKYSNTKILADTKVNLNFSQPTLKAGEEVNLKFALQDIDNNQTIKDLQPYLGEKGHLVIIKSSSPLTVSDYIHAHARKDSPDGEVDFVTSFPEAGTYKLWMQFNRNGKVNTADFWVNVQ
ncbi:hypothetical protein [Fischerella sp. NIES-3754]|uniref:hypothetical protein n=1 Tax=Fischerella sp. NIES-3754 TaxID=1752063 RepID=UPI0007215176|nr:hypothetical protein [Fischerella sp. NIES-3754]BAU04597.1 hypothetical protein FIS3754_04850 [Fischerella sp. NIES-3754]BCX06834.1 MAG: hypothetical protein KatS3mg066_0693 [Fischerella sp.]